MQAFFIPRNGKLSTEEGENALHSTRGSSGSSVDFNARFLGQQCLRTLSEEGPTITLNSLGTRTRTMQLPCSSPKPGTSRSRNHTTQQPITTSSPSPHHCAFCPPTLAGNVWLAIQSLSDSGHRTALRRTPFHRMPLSWTAREDIFQKEKGPQRSPNAHLGWFMALNRGHNSTRRPPETEVRTTQKKYIHIKIQGVSLVGTNSNA